MANPWSMEKHLDYCTHVQFPEDIDILTRKLFDVNMRLFESSGSYRALVINACNYIGWCCRTEKEGYKKPHGYSGANAGIPWNIIAYMIGENHCKVLINPKIIQKSAEIKEGLSNCGSLTLPHPVPVFRRKLILVEYYNMDGKKRSQWYNLEQKGGTIQHEIEHNLGVLINV